jgi:phosphodiesterase/alkaline phosphatase D-like protein
MNRFKFGRRKLAGLGVAGILGLSYSAHAAASFLGIAAGDATTNSATLWTRIVDSSAPAAVSLSVQVSADAGFASGVKSFSVSTDPAKDFTAKVTVNGLSSGTKYFYRFTDGTVTSDVGRFTTPPSATEARPVRFAFSGDADGLIRPYALASQVPNKNLDFFMFDGDTIYETSASIGSPAVASTGNIPAPSTNGATQATLKADFSRKYREQFLPVNVGGQAALKSFYAGQGNYTMLDNHELGNKQYINGGAPAGGPVGDMPTGAGVDARLLVNDTNTSSSDYMNRSLGFQTMLSAYLDHQPILDRGAVVAPNDPRTDGSKQLYFAQQWGRNVLLVNVDDRSYRDIRIKKASDGSDDTGSRADNPARTLLGTTQFEWLKQTLLAAERAGTPWKIVNVSDPIDQIGPIGGTLSLQNAPSAADYGLLGNVVAVTPTLSTTNSKTVTVTTTVGVVVGQPVSGPGIPSGTVVAGINTDGKTFTLNNAVSLFADAPLALSGAPSSYAPVNNDGGKAWVGGYRAERNALLKFIADNKIRNVVFLATDDHQNRINELTYSPTGETANQASYVKVPYCFTIVCGPLGATGPDLISNHSYALAKKLADSIANAQTAAGLEPIGLTGYPGLHDLTRDGNPTAGTAPQPADFYSPDTFNYNQLEVTPDGRTLTVTSYGINSTVQNSFLEYDAVNNPEKKIFSFQVDAAAPAEAVAQNITLDLLGSVEFSNNLSFTLPANTSAGLPITYVVESGPASLANGKLIVSGPGRIVLSASQKGDLPFFAAATTVSRTIDVQPGSQSIQFPELASVDNFPSLAISVNATASSGLPVSVRVVSGPALRVTDQVFSIRGAGLVVLAATQSGDGRFLPAAEVVRSFRVNGVAQTLTFAGAADTQFALGKTLALQASSSSGLAVRFTVESGPAMVQGNQLLLTGAGVVRVSAIQDGDLVYASATTTRSINISRGVQSLEFNLPSSFALNGNPLPVSAKASSGLPVRLTVVSGNAVLNGSLLSPAGIGSVVLSADQAGDANFLPASAVVQTVEFNPGLVVKVPSKGSSGTTHLSLFLDLDRPVVIEESADFKSWTPVGNAKGLGAEKPADVTLTTSPATGGSRYWRARVNP